MTWADVVWIGVCIVAAVLGAKLTACARHDLEASHRRRKGDA
ncbi:hypothetical protein [Pseudothauera rhizosphaerae]|nr:hypothetical protein [Pseudothauera rhizosphaerae]